MRKSSKFFSLTLFFSSLIIIGSCIFDHFIGGNATNGKIENGIYYVADSLLNLHEVSKVIYFLNYAYSCVTAAAIFLGAISFAVIQFRLVSYCRENNGRIGELN